MTLFTENKWNKRIVTLTFLLATSLLFYYIHTYSVNILYSDQWDFYDAFFFEKESWIELFYWQHGPHRQGISFILQKYLDQWSNWDSYYTCIAIGIFLTLSAYLYLITVRKITGQTSVFDAIIILAVLSPVQFELFTLTPNLSHGAFPAFLIALYVYCLTLPHQLIGYSLITIINLHLLFSGFGIFMGAITPILLLIQLIYAIQQNNKRYYLWYSTLLLFSFLSIYLFFINYTFLPLLSNPDIKPSILKYITFITIAFFKLLGFTKLTWYNIACAGFITLAIFTVLLHIVIIISKNIFNRKLTQLKDIIIFILIGFSLLFIIYAAIGRVAIGVETGGASRYMPYLIPSLVGLYIYLITNTTLTQNTSKKLLISYTLLVLSTFIFNDDNVRVMESFYLRKAIWKEVYLNTKDINQANKLSLNLPIYEFPQNTQLNKKLNWLNINKLNLFKDSSYSFSILDKKKLNENVLVNDTSITVDTTLLTNSTLKYIIDDQYISLILVPKSSQKVLKLKEVYFEFESPTGYHYYSPSKVQYPISNSFYWTEENKAKRNYILFAKKNNINLPKDICQINVVLQDKQTLKLIRTGLSQSLSF